jgi:hypothetical protein
LIKLKDKKVIRKFSDLIERNKDYQAFSDFKEGVNEGLELAKDTFEENAEKFISVDPDEDRIVKIKSLRDKFNGIIDTIVVKDKPNYTDEHLEGIYTGLEKSKELFEKCINETL